MSTLPDYLIQRLCENGWPRTWTRPSRRGSIPLEEQNGLNPPKWPEEEIPDAGPLLTPYAAELIGPTSVDLRVGKAFKSPNAFDVSATRDGLVVGLIGENMTEITGETVPPHFRKGNWGVAVDLLPGAVLACVSEEYCRMPPNMKGELYVKSSRAREWLDHSNATRIHAGFHGNITYEIRNDGPKPYRIFSGMRIVHMSVDIMADSAENPYFDREQAKYRGQVNELNSRDSERIG